MNNTKEMIYIPTHEDKERIIKISKEIIELLKPLKVEEKAFLLKNLNDSFYSVYNIDKVDIETIEL